MLRRAFGFAFSMAVLPWAACSNDSNQPSAAVASGGRSAVASGGKADASGGRAAQSGGEPGAAGDAGAVSDPDALGAYPVSPSTVTRGGTMTFTNVGAAGWWPRRLDREAGDPACNYKDGTDT